MTLLATLYATDEDLAVRAPGDFPVLAPRSQDLAAGADGVFLSGAPWTLTSAAVDFQGFGAAAGNVVLLTGPAAIFPAPGLLAAIAAVAPNAATLRRSGRAAGVGRPPGLGGLAGVAFRVPTLLPQIEAASYSLNQQYGISDLILGRRTSDLFDLREVRQACVLTVLHQAYFDASRQAGGNDDFFAKAKMIGDELDDLLARVALHWLPTVAGPGATSAGFGLRLTR